MARLPADLQDVVGAADIALQDGLEGGAGIGYRAEMDHRVHAGQRPGYRVPVGQVGQ